MQIEYAVFIEKMCKSEKLEREYARKRNRSAKRLISSNEIKLKEIQKRL